jgi:hypothetical protein
MAAGRSPQVPYSPTPRPVWEFLNWEPQQQTAKIPAGGNFFKLDATGRTGLRITAPVMGERAACDRDRIR